MGTVSQIDRTKYSPTRLPIITLEVCIAITVCLITFGGWNAGKIYSNMVKAWEKSLGIQSISKEIIPLDEVLTMSARMGASTGDAFWHKRYQKYEPELGPINK